LLAGTLLLSACFSPPPLVFTGFRCVSDAPPPPLDGAPGDEAQPACSEP
jgi:hypothetical protein